MACIKQKVIGLDCEWTYQNGSRQPVALMQIATAHEICVLFRLCKFKTDIPLSLYKLLADKSILKVGIDITGDCSKLFNDYDILTKGCLDLRYLIELIPEAQHIKGQSLSAIAEEVLGEKLNKSREIRCSNWQRNVLSIQQINYAAKDAIIAAQIFEKIMKWRLSKNFIQSLRLKPESDKLYEEALVVCYDVIDIPYRNKKNLLKASKIKDVSIRKFEDEKGYTTRNKSFYHNCQLQAPDGEPLCVCNTKKINWYLNKNLAVKIQDDPLIIRLTFEPAGRPILDNVYYIHEKENCCVVCGKSNSFIKKNVVPHEYRKYFPSIMKDHLSHDVLLLCVRCHKRSNAYDLMLRQQLVKECNAPLGSQDNVKFQTDPIKLKVHSAAKALVRCRSSLPENRINELEELIKNFYQIEEITPEILEEGVNINTKFTNQNYISHGQKVVQYMSKIGGLIAFETRWRKHFLDTMKPQYLPSMWSVDHNHQRLLLQVTKGNVDFDLSILIPPQEIENLKTETE